MVKEIEYLNDKYERLIASDLIAFERVVAQQKVIGVYMIYNPRQELIYIGHTNNFHVRFGTDLKHESTHTIIRKLIKTGGFEDARQVVEFLKTQCKYQIEKCDSKREAEALEHIAIYILNPLLNQ